MPEEMHLPYEAMEQLVENRHIEDLDIPRLFDLFRHDDDLPSYAPDAVCQIDPRDGALVLYNSKRAKRPHDNKTERGEETPQEPSIGNVSCPVCSGHTTGIVDIAELSEGYTFINKNLFPVLFPPQEVDPRWLVEPLYPDPSHHGRISYGMHFLQWSSSYHSRDWHNMPLEDRMVILERLAGLERKLLYNSEGYMPPSSQWRSQKETSGFVSIIKNYGAPVGGSLQHGHQQISWSNIMPRSFYNNWRFFTRHRQFFSSYLLQTNPPELQLRDYGEAVLLVPYFMKRPYNMMLIMKDVGKQYLAELGKGEIEAAAEGIRDAIVLMMKIMPKIGKETAYNMLVHNGPGAGIYFEFLPYTQETGGFEHLGMWICQGTPESTTETLRNHIE